MTLYKEDIKELLKSKCIGGETGGVLAHHITSIVFTNSYDIQLSFSSLEVSAEVGQTLRYWLGTYMRPRGFFITKVRNKARIDILITDNCELQKEAIVSAVMKVLCSKKTKVKSRWHLKLK